MTIGSTNRFARALRRNSTDAERRIWRHLRDRRLSGLKFRRQATVGCYVVDFLCAEKRLVVELDGGQHTAEGDAARTARLEELGYRVIRFWNNDALGNADAVLEAILQEGLSLPSRFKGPSSNSD